MPSPTWYPFLIHHGERRIGVYWGPDAKFAARDCRHESKSFGPVDLTGKRLTVQPYTEEMRREQCERSGVPFVPKAHPAPASSTVTSDELATSNPVPSHQTKGSILMDIRFSSLPAIGAALEGGIFGGVVTQAAGAHVAVVLLPERATEINWQAATEWAEKLGGQLPTRMAALSLYTHLKAQLPQRWHWTCETDEDDASFAWGCHVCLYGTQLTGHKSVEGCAVAVRLIPITA